MWHQLTDFFFQLIGGDANEDQLAIGQMIVRAMIVFISALIMVRIGKRRFMGGYTALDTIMGVIIGSVLSRAINGSARLTETFCAALALVCLHWLFAALSFHSERFSSWLTGSKRELIKNGEIQWDGMRKSKISRDDLMQAIRQRGGAGSLEEVESACLERGGVITVVRKKLEPHIVEIKVENGVQTVKIEIA